MNTYNFIISFFFFWPVSFRLWHRRSIFDLINWDPFDDDPFELDFFHDLSSPRIQWAGSHQHIRNPTPLVKRNDKQNYQLAIDVKGFEPKDLSIKLIGRDLLVVGEHTCERKQTRACFRRRFCWRRTLPEDVDTGSLKAAWTESNVLEIEAKKSKASESKIPITVRGRPGDHGKQNTNNHLDRAQTIRQGESEKKEEEATVEIVPDEIETKQ